MVTLDFTGIDPNSWLEAIPPYQLVTVSEMLKSKSFEEAAEAWLSSRGPESTRCMDRFLSGRAFSKMCKSNCQN
jgi:hypothetical protein